MEEEEERQARNLCALAGLDPSAEVARITWSMEDAAVAWLRMHPPLIWPPPSPTADPVAHFKHAVLQAEFDEIEDRSIERGWEVMDDLMDVLT